MATSASTFDVVCCSLEPWDEVWRRNQFFARRLLELRPEMRMLFVELSVDVPWAILHGQNALRPGLRQIGDGDRLWAMTSRKWLPRKVWPHVDRSLGRQVAATARGLKLQDPVLWINDSSYVDLIAHSGWPSVYDVTDDWVLGNYPPREIERQRDNDARMLQMADEVVVCSPALQISRGRHRAVHLIPNGVDIDHFRTPQDRPADLPAGRIVLYTGTLNAGRLDVALCTDLAEALSGKATLVFVGPDSLTAVESRRLTGAGAALLGARPYSQLPGYLQHADVLVVPHVITRFTESLDPIKAREIMAVGRATVSTPVAGFRNLGDPVTLAAASEFSEAVIGALARADRTPGVGPMPVSLSSWNERAAEFLAVLDAAAARCRRQSA